ncbi:MAG: transporter substrate-binding domain-containing protein [Lentisphaerales bacterium]|nr:transporter substrate-binding domain-containing protein [Lentisphaerales bacterium]
MSLFKRIKLLSCLILFSLSLNSAEKIKAFAGIRGHSEKPFSYWPLALPEPTGFDPDLLRLVAKEMNVEISFVQIDLRDNWIDIRREVLDKGIADLVSYAYTISEDRKKSLNFSKPHLKSYMKALVLKSSKMTSIEDIQNKPILAPRHTTGYQWAKKNHKGPILTDSPPNFKGTIEDMIKQKIISAFIGDEDNLRTKANNDQKLTVIDQYLMAENLGIAISKSNPDLLAKVNEAIESLEKSGKLVKLREKFFPKDRRLIDKLYAWKLQKVNLKSLSIHEVVNYLSSELQGSNIKLTLDPNGQDLNSLTLLAENISIWEILQIITVKEPNLEIIIDQSKVKLSILK